MMEDFYYAGGRPAVMREIGDLLYRDQLTVNGKTIWENVANAPCYDREVIRDTGNPVKSDAGLAVLRGNLCAAGAIIKPSAATPELMNHSGRAVVFDSIESFNTRIDDPDLAVDENSVLVLKNCGPRGYPGMPEVGNMRLPAKLLSKGIRDIVRISDARMSGTAYGTVILHVAPEAAAGGTLAIVQDGDVIELDVAARKLNLKVPEMEIAQRLSDWKALPAPSGRGYARLYFDNVMPADCVADLDLLVGGSRAGVW